MIYAIYTLIILVFGIPYYYSARIIKKTSLFNSIKNKALVWTFSLIPSLLLLLFFNYLDATIIVIHFDVFIIIAYLIMKALKKENYNKMLIITSLVTILFMSYAFYQNYHISETVYNIKSDKINEPFRIIQISDTHIGSSLSSKRFYKEMENISKIETDLFVITGDFIDDDTSYEEMKNACSAFSLINAKYGVYFVNGNHDRGYSEREYSYDDVLNELSKNNVVVLMDDVIEINDYITLIGREDKHFERKNISDLVSDKTKYIIDLNHQPNDYEAEKGVVDLVLSGHTHGGQLFPFGLIGLLISANDNIQGIKTIDNTNFIITSGMSGWKMSFKSATKSEYVIINISGK